MRKVLSAVLAIFVCSNIMIDNCNARSGVAGPWFSRGVYAGWGAGTVPTAYFAAGGSCRDNADTTDPMTLCETVVAIGQAACTNHEWSEHDMDISNVSVGGNCWCRRTHVQVNLTDTQLTPDTGQWMLRGIFDSAADCMDVCADRCAGLFNVYCPRNIGQLMLLPAY